MSKSPAYSWKMLRTDPIIATGQLFFKRRLLHALLRFHPCRNAARHGTNEKQPPSHQNMACRLFAPITCFVVKKRITSVPHRRSALPGSPLCRRPSRSKGAIPQGATCSFSSVSKRVFPRSESFRMTAPPKRYLLSGLRVIQLRKVGGGNLNQVAFNRSVSIFNAEHDVSLSL